MWVEGRQCRTFRKNGDTEKTDRLPLIQERKISSLGFCDGFILHVLTDRFGSALQSVLGQGSKRRMPPRTAAWLVQLDNAYKAGASCSRTACVTTIFKFSSIHTLIKEDAQKCPRCVLRDWRIGQREMWTVRMQRGSFRMIEISHWSVQNRFQDLNPTSWSLTSLSLEKGIKAEGSLLRTVNFPSPSNSKFTSDHYLLNPFTMSSIFCCPSITPYREARLMHETKFQRFMTWSANSQSSPVTDSESYFRDPNNVPEFAIQCVQQVNYGPVEAKRYFIPDPASFTSREGRFLEVSEKDLIFGNFQKLNTSVQSFDDPFFKRNSLK